MNGLLRLVAKAALLLVVLLQAACVTYTVRTAVGPAQLMPTDFFGVSPGPVALEAFRKNGWAAAETHEDGTQFYVRGAAPNSDVSEAEAVVRHVDKGQAQVDLVRLRYGETRLATYRELVKRLVERHGAPQLSEERASFPEFALDPRSDHPRPSRVIVHRWRGAKFDIVLVGGLESAENLASSMDYQLLLLPPERSAVSSIP